MSNYLAIATVTAALKLSLKAAAETALGVEVNVTTVRPETPENGAAGAHLNLYLYQVTPNAAWRNADLPMRNASGALIDRPRLALDLHYLLSFYGDDDKLLPQRLLGCVARTLHTRSVLTRKMIQDTIANPTFDYVADSNLAEGVELVKFTPVAMSLEELSKLWSVFFQTPHALSLAYQGTVVLIESEEPHQQALPVRQRNLYVMPFRQPTIESVQSIVGPGEPIVFGGELLIRGRHFSSEATQVQVGSSEPVVPRSVSDQEIRLSLTEAPIPAAPFPSGTLRAGVQGVQVIQPMMLGTPPAPHRGMESNVAAFVLRPTIIAPITASAAGTSITVTVKLAPNVDPEQRVLLLLNELQSDTPSAYSFTTEPRPSINDTIEFAVSGVTPGDYLVRVQVDGAESPLITDANGRFIGPEVTIP